MRPFDPRLPELVPVARPAVAALALLGGLQGVVAIGQAFAVSVLVVALVAGAPLTGPAIAVVALFAVRGLLATAGELTAAWAGSTVSTALRERLVRSWSGRPAEDRPEPAAALPLATQGTASVEPYVARYLPALVQAAVLPVLALVAITAIDWVSGLIVLVTVPLLPAFAALIGHATAEETTRRWRAMASLSGHFFDVVRGLPTLVSFGRATVQSEAIAEVSQRHRRATVRTLRIAFLSSGALELLATISVAMVAVAAGLRLATGSMPLGVALTVILLAPEAYWPIRRVGVEFHAAADGAAALDDVAAHLDRAPSRPVCPLLAGAAGPKTGLNGANRAVGSTTTVRVRGLAYRYPGADDEALHDLNLSVGPGLTAVTGASGAGKSTLLELLAGLRTPTHGSIEAPPAHLVTQRPFLLAGALRESLLLGAAADTGDGALWSALRQVGLHGLVAGLPGGLDTPMGDDGFGFSAGQRGRLALARASLSDVPLLLLDEPTAHLDDGAATLVHALIGRLSRERTVIVVTHRPELLRYAVRHVTLPARRPVGAAP